MNPQDANTPTPRTDAVEISSNPEINIPTLDEINECLNTHCAGNKSGKCVMVGHAICYGYFPPSDSAKPL